MKKWNDLKKAGYVVELDECQVAEAKSKFNPLPFEKIKTKEEQEKINDERERKMRLKNVLS